MGYQSPVNLKKGVKISQSINSICIFKQILSCININQYMNIYKKKKKRQRLLLLQRIQQQPHSMWAKVIISVNSFSRLRKKRNEEPSSIDACTLFVVNTTTVLVTSWHNKIIMLVKRDSLGPNQLWQFKKKKRLSPLWATNNNVNF